MFIVLAGLIFFTWGEIFSLFPAIATDTYGAKCATANAGLLYTAKGIAVWVVPLASVVKNYSGTWHLVFVIAAIMNLAVAALALFVLKPLRHGITRHNQTPREKCGSLRVQQTGIMHASDETQAWDPPASVEQGRSGISTFRGQVPSRQRRRSNSFDEIGSSRGAHTAKGLRRP
jgi:hypothetical protein